MEIWKKVRKWLLPVAVTLLALGLVLCLIIPSFAWLKTSREAPFRLGADPVPDISLYVGNAAYKNPDNPAAGYHLTWSKPLSMTDMRTAESFGAPLKNADFSVAVNAAMGVIDQLDAGSLDATNFTWFCIRVHEDEGLQFKDIKVEFAQEPFQFFGSDWNQAGEPGVIHHMPAGQDAVGLILQDVFADDRVIPKMMEIAAPTRESKGFVTTVKPADDMILPTISDQKGHVGRFGNAGVLPAEEIPQNGYYQVTQVDENGYYYIYFRMGPDLGAYYLIVDYLFMHMPCYLSFDGLTVSIDVKK